MPTHDRFPPVPSPWGEVVEDERPFIHLGQEARAHQAHEDDADRTRASAVAPMRRVWCSTEASARS